MPGIDERLSRELERLAAPADPAGAYERVVVKRSRRHALRRVQQSALAVVVIAGTLTGAYGLNRAFRAGTGGQMPSTGLARNGRIAFGLSNGVDLKLFSMNPDGSDRVRIPTPGHAGLPAYSPDGSRLAVSISSKTHRSLWIYVMNADGSNPHRIAAPGIVGGLSWAPNGVEIAYVAHTRDGSEIHVIGADGSKDRILGVLDPRRSYSASFSPDGQQIVYDATTDGVGFDIFVMDVDGSNVRRLTTTNRNYDPAWSPDGSVIAFTREEKSTESDLFVMKADGSDVRRLTEGGAGQGNRDAVWSPDGSRIAYQAGKADGRPGGLVVMDADGSDPVTLVEDDVLGIAWQPLLEGDVPTPSPSPSPSEEPGRDLGLGYPVCNVSRIRGDFLGSGTTGTAWVATKLGDVGGCPAPGEGFSLIAIDVDGDGTADASHGHIECDLGACLPFAVPDLDGNGSAELLVSQRAFSILGLGVYAVRAGGSPSGDGPALFPVEIASPGDPDGGFRPGTQAVLDLGGDGFNASTLQCEDGPEGRVLVAISAVQRPPDRVDSVWRAHETRFVLETDGQLHVIGVRNFEEPFTTDAPSFQSGERLCGSNLGP